MSSYDQSLAPVSSAPLVSRRLYNGICFGLLTISFAVMFLMYSQFTSGALDFLFTSSTSALIFLIASLVGSIGGIIAMGVGKSRQSVAVSLAGYAVFSLTFGLTLALSLAHYTTQTISVALAITACLAGIFMIAGIIFPEFFAAISRILVLALIGVIVVELLATVIFRVDQTFFDYVTIAIFCGFIGYDTFQLAADDPTVPNAVYHACDIYIDIANILIRVLALLDRD